MKYDAILIIIIGLFVASCNKSKEKTIKKEIDPNSFVLSFGSCNNQNLKNNMWAAILENNPNVFIWSGDIIYADTDNMAFMKKNYEMQKNDSSYVNFTKQVPVIDT